MILLQDSSEVRVGLETLDSAFLATITSEAQDNAITDLEWEKVH